MAHCLRCTALTVQGFRWNAQNPCYLHSRSCIVQFTPEKQKPSKLPNPVPSSCYSKTTSIMPLTGAPTGVPVAVTLCGWGAANPQTSKAAKKCRGRIACLWGGRRPSPPHRRAHRGPWSVGGGRNDLLHRRTPMASCHKFKKVLSVGGSAGTPPPPPTDGRAGSCGLWGGGGGRTRCSTDGRCPISRFWHFSPTARLFYCAASLGQKAPLRSKSGFGVRRPSCSQTFFLDDTGKVRSRSFRVHHPESSHNEVIVYGSGPPR